MINSELHGNQGIIIPIDIEALCVGSANPAIFKGAPYNFSLLSNPPYLSNTAKPPNTPLQTGAGVHLHWALPDALTKGKQSEDKTDFPAVPDRWLITRISSDPQKSDKPAFKSWVIESNLYAEKDPNKILDRNSVTIPYQGDEWGNQPWRHLGKVTTLEDWLQNNPSAALVSDSNTYVEKLTAVGFGMPEFAASYQQCKSILGFNDLSKDLDQLASKDDVYLSYQIIGWYSNPNNDPARKLPPLLTSNEYRLLLDKIIDADQKSFFIANYLITTYALKDGATGQIGIKLWNILDEAGYPVSIEIPENLKAEEFTNLLSKISVEGDKKLLQDWYLAEYGLSGLPDADQPKMWEILSAAGYDFTADLFANEKWSLPSSKTNNTSPVFSMYSGVISNILWNPDTNYFSNEPGNDFNIAIGNTPAEALSALISSTGSFTDPIQTEEILDALQTNLLDQVDDESMLNDWEQLKATLHKNSFSSYHGGILWEIKSKKKSDKDEGELTLPDDLADELNTLNVQQKSVNDISNEIISWKKDIFEDWYQFMQTLYPQAGADYPVTPRDLAVYITNKINEGLTPAVSKLENLNKALGDQIDKVNNLINSEAPDLVLSSISSPRYWQPNEPVVLFEGNGIEPTDRYGNDGRYMSNDTLVCRLSDQLITALNIPAKAFGNVSELKLDSTTFSLIPNPNKNSLIDALNLVLLDGALLSTTVISSELRGNGVTTDFAALSLNVQKAIDSFLAPDIPQKITKDQFNAILGIISEDDNTFLNTQYVLSGSDYDLKSKPEDLLPADVLHINYILNSAAYNPSNESLSYTGLPFSLVGFQEWTENPWLPYSLDWIVNFFPLKHIGENNVDYDPAFITSNFKIGDVNLEYTGESIDLTVAGIEQYSNTIFLTPHAGINLRKQLSSFINNHPDDPIKPDLKDLLDKLIEKPVLSQSLSGFNDELLMLLKEMQLPVNDPLSGDYFAFTNKTVKGEVEDNNSAVPQATNSYNPIRCGLLKISSLTITDVFGRMVRVENPAHFIRANNMIQTVLNPTGDIYLPPRVTQFSRLLFRWLASDNDEVEMNSHPATSPICGWVLANHLDSSLWVYDQKGTPYGSLNLNSDKSAILWQCTPGSPYFFSNLPDFLEAIEADVNPHFKAFLTALYGDAKEDAAKYLDAFLQSLDTASLTNEPQNYRQYQSDAVLMGRPYALARASLKLQLLGDQPSYNRSWDNLKTVVNSENFNPGNDNGFSKVNFPVKLGNISQIEDGLIGYFKENNYNTFYAPSVKSGGNGVVPPADDNITLEFDPASQSEIVSILMEPRGKIHATTGILPVKAIEIPPDQYLNALMRMELCFLVSPVLSNIDVLAMPLPAQTGGVWSWVENEGTTWTEKQQIATVTTQATFNYNHQKISEGWLNLALHILEGSNFGLVNKKTGKPELIISDDPNDNILTFSIKNPGKTAIALAGGDPIDGPYKNKGSSFVLNFDNMLSTSTVSGLKIEAITGDWKSQYYPAGENKPGSISIASTVDTIIESGKSIDFTISNIIVNKGTAPGNFNIDYFGLPGYPDSIGPVSIFITINKDK